MYSAKNTESIKGNSQMFRVHGIKTVKRKHPDVLQLINEGFEPVEFGSRIWRASYLLIDYLSRQSIASDQHVIELGCGWGLPSVYVRKYFGATVTSSDVDNNVFPFQRVITRINQADVIQKRSSFCELSANSLHRYDVLMGADICYSKSHARMLESLIDNYAAQRNGRIVFADSGRMPFFHLVERLSSRYELSLLDVSIDLPIKVQGHVMSLEVR